MQGFPAGAFPLKVSNRDVLASPKWKGQVHVIFFLFFFDVLLGNARQSPETYGVRSQGVVGPLALAELNSCWLTDHQSTYWKTGIKAPTNCSRQGGGGRMCSQGHHAVQHNVHHSARKRKTSNEQIPDEANSIYRLFLFHKLFTAKLLRTRFMSQRPPKCRVSQSGFVLAVD